MWHGELAQMVERLLSMEEVTGSMPVFSIFFSSNYFFFVLPIIFYEPLLCCTQKYWTLRVLIKIPTIFCIKIFNKTQTQILNLRIFLLYVIVLIFVSHNLNLQIDWVWFCCSHIFWQQWLSVDVTQKRKKKNFFLPACG